MNQPFSPKANRHRKRSSALPPRRGEHFNEASAPNTSGLFKRTRFRTRNRLNMKQCRESVVRFGYVDGVQAGDA